MPSAKSWTTKADHGACKTHLLSMKRQVAFLAVMRAEQLQNRRSSAPSSAADSSQLGLNRASVDLLKTIFFSLFIFFFVEARYQPALTSQRDIWSNKRRNPRRILEEFRLCFAFMHSEAGDSALQVSSYRSAWTSLVFTELERIHVCALGLM